MKMGTTLQVGGGLGLLLMPALQGCGNSAQQATQLKHEAEQCKMIAPNLWGMKTEGFRTFNKPEWDDYVKSFEETHKNLEIVSVIGWVMGRSIPVEVRENSKATSDRYTFLFMTKEKSVQAPSR